MNNIIMQLGGFYIWTYTYGLIKKDAKVFHGNQSEPHRFTSNEVNTMEEGGQGVSTNQNILPVTAKSAEEVAETQLVSGIHRQHSNSCKKKETEN